MIYTYDVSIRELYTQRGIPHKNWEQEKMLTDMFKDLQKPGLFMEFLCNNKHYKQWLIRQGIDNFIKKKFTKPKRRRRKFLELEDGLRLSSTIEDMMMMQVLIRRNSISDIFKDITFAKKDNFLEQVMKPDYQTFLAQKLRLRKLQMQIQRIQLFNAWEMMKGVTYINSILTRLEIVREKFIMELQNGVAVFIPPDLSQDNLPASYRYYDPIIRIIQENMSGPTQKMMGNQKCLLNKMYVSFLQQFVERLKEKTSEEDKVRQFYYRPNELIAKISEISHKGIQEAHHLQRSKYIKVDSGSTYTHDLDLFHYEPNKKEIVSDKIFLDFCLPREINEQRSKMIIFKGTFGLKQRSLKSNFTKLQTMLMVENWIDQNIQHLHMRYYDGYFEAETRKLDLWTQRRYAHKELQMKRLKARLLDIAQNMLDKRYSKVRVSTIKKYQGLVDKRLPFEYKNSNLDRRIETTYQTFDFCIIKVLNDFRVIQKIIQKIELKLDVKQR